MPWRDELAKRALIVPSPMSALTGRTKEGKESAHCLENTGPRRFLVVEQDPRLPADATEDEKQQAADEQAAVLMHLAERVPLALAGAFRG